MIGDTGLHDDNSYGALSPDVLNVDASIDSVTGDASALDSITSNLLQLVKQGLITYDQQLILQSKIDAAKQGQVISYQQAQQSIADSKGTRDLEKIALFGGLALAGLFLLKKS